MIWLAVFFPLLGAICNGFLLPRNQPKLSHSVAIFAVLGAFVSALFAVNDFFSGGNQHLYFFGFPWIEAGLFKAPFELVLDQMSVLMLLVVTGIGTLIHIYAGGYMHEEAKTYRFFAYLNLFVFMMLLLVLGNNLLLMFVGWEGVGACSYLLIGYWFEDTKNADAGMKAFVVNRIGDIGFLLGMFLTFQTFHTLSFHELRDIALDGHSLDQNTLTSINWITLCFFIGACGKSAQLPLYVWLPDAMAGPTPVSALIHAATMVTAGIYMMTKLSFFYYLAPWTMEIVAVVGALTALFAATIALVQSDIKKVLAYSTVSQLGYMVLGCGVGAFDAGVFHLLTHACFKALLFLGAGSVIVAMHHKQDMMEMGGLRKHLPITHGVFLIGVLAIIGFPGLAGFFSKDEILWKSYIMPGFGPALWAVAAVTAGLTSFYMTRLLTLTFYGENRSDHHTQEHLHETSPIMWGPLVVLAILSVTVGYLGLPAVIAESFGTHNFFEEYLKPMVRIPEQAHGTWSHLHAEHSHSLEWGLMGASTAIVLLMSGLALFLYRKGPEGYPKRIRQSYETIYNLLLNKYWIDEIYKKIVVTPLREMSLFLTKIVDMQLINGLINGLGRGVSVVGATSSLSSDGSIHRYGFVMIFALIFLVSWLLR